jgi:phosphohistidine swiveling domain-containing protein
MAVALAECADLPVARVGGKAQALGAALRAGFPVPPGVVVEPTEDVRPEAIVSMLGAGPFAVRSSAPHEDGARASWAGQLLTRLWVDAAALAQAVRDVRESGETAAARAYGGGSGAVPALVQPIVAADAAGVMFTIDPRDGRDDRCVVEAVAGLGDPLADGRAEPARFLFDSLSEELIEADHREAVDLDAAQLAELVDLGLRVSEWRGEPLDIEWAWALGRAWLLQARPITAASWSPAPGQWTAANFKEVMPGVVTPLTASFGLEDNFPRATSDFAADLGVVRRGQRITEGRRFYGHAYWRVDTVKDAMLKLPGFRERAFDATVGIAASYDGDGRTSRLTPSTLRHAIPALRAMRRAYREDGAAAGRYRDAFAAEEAEWLAIDWQAITDMELEMRVREAIEQHWRTNRWAMRVSFLSEQAQDDLRGALGRLASRLDPPPSEGLLLSGVEELATGRAARALADLGARHAQRRGAVLAAERPEELPSPLREELLGLVASFGFMAEADEELLQPRWDEDPSIPLALLKATIGVVPGRATRAGADEEERRVLRAAAWRARSVRRKIGRARRYAWWREELREVLMRTNRLTRRAFLALGDCWALRGLIAGPDDVFWMTAAEVTAVLDGRLELSCLAMQVPRRRRHADRFRGWRPPDTLGALPHAGRSGTAQECSLAGTACSSGVAEGPVCVLRSLEEAPKAVPGSILVLEYSNPGWTPVYVVAAGLVTEEGGLLSHGSIVARERGLPAVIQVRDATRLLHDGQRVRVDGDRGTVLVLDDESDLNS